jgi:hypothetical protein
MKHPEIIVIPVLMLMDYFLTLVSARMAEKKYRLHFKFPEYELNPLFQKSVRDRRWLNLRYLALFALAVALLISLEPRGGEREDLFQFLAGAMLVVFGSAVGRHLGNLMLLRYLATHPDDVSGQVVLSQTFQLVTSESSLWALLVPLVFIAFFTRQWYAIGGLVGIIFFMGVHEIWKLRAKRSRLKDNWHPDRLSRPDSA